MGRKRNISVREFFILEGNTAKCKACEAKMNAEHLTNLKRHIQKHHSELFIEQEEASKMENSFDHNDKKVKFYVEMSVNDFTNSCINLLTKDSYPLSLFDSDSFQTITKGIVDGLKIQKVNSRNVMNFVSDKYAKIKNKIIQLTSNKIVCLKMDTATRLDRAILGINVQLIVNNRLQILTLAMIELKRKHTGENLKLEIENVLNDFNINKKQVYAITTDNGRNMLKAVELLSEHCDENEIESESGEDFENIVDNDDTEINNSVRQANYEIDNYKEKRLDISADLLEYWENKKFSLPWLRRLALILHSVPATQVSVERSFSALKLILSDLRYNLSEKHLESIIMVKLNT